VLNFVVNAEQAMASMKRGQRMLTIRTRDVDGRVYCEVEDTGPGIPESERQRVFDRFYRILGSNVDGSGLGLSIVREISEQHGALLRVSFNPGSSDSALPGTLISVEFEAIVTDDPTLKLDDTIAR